MRSETALNLLIVDDELSMRELLDFVFRDEGFTVFLAESISAARKALEDHQIHIVISDMRLGDGNGLDLLKDIRQAYPEILFILITAYASADSAIDALKYGAYDYITKPFDVDDLKKIVQNAAEKAFQQKTHKVDASQEIASKHAIIGVSPAMIRIYKTIGVIAPNDSTILLTGESGTGKEMVARVIHNSGPRKQYPFVSINCGAFPETLLESELFGFQKGAFTGAVGTKKGLFEVAHRGTLFLDEIAETTPAMQVKLLRSIQEKKIRRLGTTDEIPIDVRIIVATNKDLDRLIQDNLFREDLYYRIAVIPIHLPPLRERREDIPLLANFFLKKFNRKLGKSIDNFSVETMQSLLQYDWRGNVRELENVVERAVAMETTDQIQKAQLPSNIREYQEETAVSSAAVPELQSDGIDLDSYLQDIEKKLIIQALEKSGGVQVEAAKILRITYRSLRHRMQKLDIRY
jgi:two-component system response regulator PilR (NtrC family)